jgi:hypothetical protein
MYQLILYDYMISRKYKKQKQNYHLSITKTNWKYSKTKLELNAPGCARES